MTATQMLPEDRQRALESAYSSANVNKYLIAEIEGDGLMQSMLKRGVELLREWLNEEHYESKAERIAPLHSADLEDLVKNVFLQVMYCQAPEKLVSVAGRVAGYLHFDDKPAAIKTTGEILGLLCETDFFDINKASSVDQLYVECNFTLSKELQEFMDRSLYPLPMICQPTKLRHNRTSGYLTTSDSLILGQGNHHNGDICLDVLERQNQIPLTLCVDLMYAMEERPNKPITVEYIMHKAQEKGNEITMATAKAECRDRIASFEQFRKQSIDVYALMVKNGNRFHLTNRVDKRGRVYSMGYHIHTQGSAFKKAIVELANTEVVEGVPDHLRTNK